MYKSENGRESVHNDRDLLSQLIVMADELVVTQGNPRNKHAFISVNPIIKTKNVGGTK